MVFQGGNQNMNIKAIVRNERVHTRIFVSEMDLIVFLNNGIFELKATKVFSNLKICNNKQIHHEQTSWANGTDAANKTYKYKG